MAWYGPWCLGHTSSPRLMRGIDQTHWVEAALVTWVPVEGQDRQLRLLQRTLWVKAGRDVIPQWILELLKSR